MAWLQTYPSGIYHLNFPYGGQKFKQSLKTKSKAEAEARLQRLEENIRLVESGRLEMPEDADISAFLLSDGRLNKKPAISRSLTLSELFARYFASLPKGSLEQTTLNGIKIHQRHLERRIGRMDRDVVEKYAEQDQPLFVRASRSSLRCAPCGRAGVVTT